MKPETVKIELIVSTYENPEALLAILERIAHGSLLPQTIHVADDGSGDATRTLLRDLIGGYPFPLHHHWQEDEGFRKCRILNIALSHCETNYIVFLDGDCLPHRHFLRDHAQLAERGHFVQGRRCFVAEDAVAPLLSGDVGLRGIFLQGKLSGLFKSIRWPSPIILRNQEQRGLIGCNWAAWRQDLIEVNGFDEEYEGWGIGEDSDMCSRLYNLGLTRKFVYGRALVFHLDHPETSKSHVGGSLRRLEGTIMSGKTRCEVGLDRHRVASL